MTVDEIVESLGLGPVEIIETHPQRSPAGNNDPLTPAWDCPTLGHADEVHLEPVTGLSEVTFQATRSGSPVQTHEGPRDDSCNSREIAYPDALFLGESSTPSSDAMPHTPLNWGFDGSPDLAIFEPDYSTILDQRATWSHLITEAMPYY